MMLTFW